VIDGDTVCVACPLAPEGNIVCFKVRLAGINCPEISKRSTVSSEERKVGLEAKRIVEERWLHKLVRVTVQGYEVWGRLLAQLEDEAGVNLSQWLLKEHLAVEYNGTGKVSVDWPSYRNELGK